MTIQVSPSSMEMNAAAVDRGSHPTPSASPLDYQLISSAASQFDLEPEIGPEDESTSPNKEPVDKNSQHWYKTMCRHLSDANGAVSGAVLSFVKKNLENTKLILVLGQAGTGKSTILEELTGQKLTTAGTLKSGTRTYQVCPALIDDGQYLFIDTAGFGAADIDDIENFKDIMACLYSLGLMMTPTGVMFVFGKAGSRFMKHDLKTVRWIECLCGPEFFRNITIITSMWDKHTERDFPDECRKIDELVSWPDIAQILKPSRKYDGGIMYHHGLPGGKLKGAQYASVMFMGEHDDERKAAIRQLIRDRYAKCKPVKLQVMKDARNRASWRDSEAAKVLLADQSKIEIKITADHAIVCEKNSTMVWIPKDKSRETGETKKSQKRNDAGWWEALPRWYEVIRSVSEFFAEIRKMRNELYQQKPPAWSLWGYLKNWTQRWSR
ncbi:50S ribosome-binding GTPase domain-containing protein [Trichoderma breve]|uniref:50S ribosome-binding GTPase domain-containing protein n=1 Tax=Trichoderma breve TaxID=2034170 RepID=A0A9W9EEZ8_9HYPO|nr:50S ribosome-binding GTPase domain-containing protein [Trichoderma breve]KAJ4865449.1 50S ribosome-binding GTPase domain-containing protein [Trichoderma breve]